MPNPFREGLEAERPPEPCAIVIFGARGDLARRKLFPALMNLARDGRLADSSVIVGIMRGETSDDGFRRMVFDSAAEFAPDAPQDDDFKRRFGARLFTCIEDPPAGEGFARLPQMLPQLAEKYQTHGNTLYYLSVPPSSFVPIVRQIARSGLAQSPQGGWTRIIIEKPFGRDLQSTHELGCVLEDVFREEQIYRIDHYMGKEAVQNILVLRLANAFLEPLWNYRYIDHVQITAAESLGVEDRAAYYEEAGALRDMVQNHLLQILAMIAMEPPASLAPEAIRNEKTKVLESIRPLSPDDIRHAVVRAQYSAGAVGGRNVRGYSDEPGVKPDTRTETFVAARFWIDNWRWNGVPFYLRTGKRLPKRITEVAIHFKPVPHMVFAASAVDLVEPNVLSIRIQPGEGITLKFMAKIPGITLRLRPVDMEFRYGTSFGGRISDAYERLLLDAMLGDPTLFPRRDAVEQAWKLTTPLLEAWARENHTSLPQYEAGSWGPPEADLLMEADGRRWRRL